MGGKITMDAQDDFNNSEDVACMIDDAAMDCIKYLIMPKVIEFSKKHMVGANISYADLLSYYNAEAGKDWNTDSFQHVNNVAYKLKLDKLLGYKGFTVLWYDSNKYVQLLWHDWHSISIKCQK